MGSPALHDFDAAVVLRHPALDLADDGEEAYPSSPALPDNIAIHPAPGARSGSPEISADPPGWGTD